MDLNKAIDIIIPIYNAFEELQKCLESINKYTNLNQHRLVLINDNSSDNRIKDILQKQKSLYQNAIVVNNEINRGFSNNINIGIDQSNDRDVILLNSDTVVTENWVNKILTCAYSHESIGTVTPLSNNASLCSVPAFCEENKLPPSISIDKAAQIVERCSLRRYPEITVANGFCMFIKRDVINKIGNFDAETFGKGYGEENDFCNRAGQVGYVHVMCDDTYIFHSGTKSFISEEKQKLNYQHELILNQRYPIQVRANQIHCRDNPNQFVGQNISLYFDLCNNKPNILYLLQSDFKTNSSGNIGGTQLHVKCLKEGLKDNFNIFVAAREGEFLNLTIYSNGEEKCFAFYCGKEPCYYYPRSRELENILRNILVAFQIDLVHVHHTLSSSLDIYYLAEEYHLPVMLTAHDFFYVCPTIRLFDYEDKTCYNLESKDCEKCLKNTLDISNGSKYMDYWKQIHSEALEICKSIIVPSNSARHIFEEYYPEISDKMKVIEHGYDLGVVDVTKISIEYSNQIQFYIENIKTGSVCVKVSGWAYEEGAISFENKIFLEVVYKDESKEYIPTSVVRRLDVSKDENKYYCGFDGYIPRSQALNGECEINIVIQKKDHRYLKTNGIKFQFTGIENNEKKFNVAFIGGINSSKGGNEIIQIIKKGDSSINWYVMGGIGVPELLELNRDNLVKTGNYCPEHLSELLKIHKIDLICILSIWPETFSYTLSEAVLCRIPVIVTDVGALGERVKNMKCGWTVPLCNIPSEVIAIIEKLKTNKNMYDEVLKQIDHIQLKGCDSMIQEYKDLYLDEVNSRRIYENKFDQELIWKSYVINLNHKNDSKVNDLRTNHLEEELLIIKNSVAYKVALKMRGIKKALLKIIGKK